MNKQILPQIELADDLLLPTHHALLCVMHKGDKNINTPPPPILFWLTLRMEYMIRSTMLKLRTVGYNKPEWGLGSSAVINSDWNIREEREVSVSFHCQFYLILQNLWIVCQYKSTHIKYFFYLWYKDLVYKSMYLLQMHRLKLAQTSPKI